MAYSELPWRPFLGHQAWIWTTLRRGNVFYYVYKRFFLFLSRNVFYVFNVFKIFIWTFFTSMEYCDNVCLSERSGVPHPGRFRPSPLTRNRRLDPSQHDGLDASIFEQRIGCAHAAAQNSVSRELGRRKPTAEFKWLHFEIYACSHTAVSYKLQVTVKVFFSWML